MRLLQVFRIIFAAITLILFLLLLINKDYQEYNFLRWIWLFMFLTLGSSILSIFIKKSINKK
ncbi:hypothetical protein PATY110618_17610 [Paenibacillus typhae]|uniref:Uncharacterized protein n=1 Tax=Paenibacillus typhae TaxID=1174501 RepID=A0A1G9BHF4_9BACL|nr:hypothetical protein SAMN05216192_14020 [Paenibacillus typhae]